jgi:hypothetical protein
MFKTAGYERTVDVVVWGLTAATQVEEKVPL